MLPFRRVSIPTAPGSIDMSASESGILERRPLGRSGATISAIGLGGGNWGREIDEESSYRVMDYALEKGITFFDTGDSYGGKQSWESRKAAYGTTDQRETTLEMYSSEKIIGRWMRSRGCRDQIEICTKVGTGGSPENIHRVVEGSMERLGVSIAWTYSSCIVPIPTCRWTRPCTRWTRRCAPGGWAS